jgi:hypothetical protein
MKNNLPKNFDWKTYLDNYEDLRNAGFKTEQDVITHYLKYGKFEGRSFMKKAKGFGDHNREEVFRILCQKMMLTLNDNFTKIDNKSYKKSLLIETRILPHTEFVIKNTIQKLGDGWGHIVYCGVDNYEQIKNICNTISVDIDIRLLDFQINRNSYNNLLLNIGFWDSLECEKVLIYQTDTFIFKDFEESFLEWDYIGAPWGPSTHLKKNKLQYNFDYEVNVGNGGLSLRTVDALKDILKIYKPDINLNVNKEKNGCEFIYEDLFFSYYITKFSKYKIPPLEIAKQFSWEHLYNEDTFGCHQPFVKSFEDDNNFLKFINNFKGVNLIGFGNIDSGLGHNMRIIYKSLSNCKIPTNITFVNGSKFHEYLEKDKFNFFDTNIFMCNPDVDYRLFGDLFTNKKNIALWAWELDKIPEKWKESSKYFDEVWTISDFCMDVFKKEIPNKIIKKLDIPADFRKKMNKEECKEILGFKNKFICLFIFDFNSDINRKNPMSVIETFKSSISKFGDTLLILKTHNMKDSEMDRYFGVLPNNVMIINETWSKNKLDILFNSSDIYISLHRSEGSGLTIMEAIDLEIPVICTNYSGNLDFCDENCQLVKYELVDVDCVHPSYLGVKNTKWSEPSIKDASDKLLKVYNNYVYYSEKIKITKEKLIRKYNVNSLGETIKKFLEV